MTNYYRYGAWDGSQHVLDVDAEALLDAMSDDLLEEGDLWRALQRLFRQGAQNREGQRFPGLQDLLQQLRQKRQQQLQRSNLGDALKDIREKLQQIQHTEREGIDKKVDDGRQKTQNGDIPPQLQKTMERMAQEHREQLDQLPADVPGQIQGLQNYDFMDPNARQMFQELVQDPGLRRELASLMATLEELAPMDDLRRRYPFRGEESLNLEQAMQVMQDLQEMDRLERQMREAIDTADPNAIDREILARQLGEQAQEQLDQLDQVTRLLEEAGLVERKGDQLELTPRAIRKIGQKALRDIFQHLARDRFGNHEADHRGRGGDRSDDTKAYEFGDPFLLDLRSTLQNSMIRQGG